MSAMLSLKVTGMEKALATLRVPAQVAQDVRADQAEANRAGLEVLQEGARSRCPVRSGRLRDSIAIQDVGEDGGRLVAGAPYSGYVDGGTKRMAAEPFMGDTVREDGRRAAQATSAVMTSAIARRTRDLLGGK